MKPKGTLWTLEPHTRGKHEVLRHYLQAWFPILGFTAGRIVFIDGFAGPGLYRGGEEGSPLVALKVLLEHQSKLPSEVRFLFIERDKGRAAHLDALVSAERSRLPPKCTIEVFVGAFDETMGRALDMLDKQGERLAPAFVMADPFGVSDTPMKVFRRILQGQKTEVYISFMYEAISRFKATPQFEGPLTELYGTDEWREGVELTGEAKTDFFFGLYDRQLRRSGAKHVIRFDLYEGNRLVYAIFFATHHWMGADRMKQAIWKVAPFGDFAFHGTHSSQLTLGITDTDYSPLRAALQSHYRGKGWQTIDDVIQFVGSDQTDYHSLQLKKPVLAPMETDGLIEIDPQSRRKRRTYPSGTRLRFT